MARAESVDGAAGREGPMVPAELVEGTVGPE